MINTLVIGGGGYYGLITLGILKELQKQSFLNLKEIKTIYGTSIGSLIGVLCCIDIDMDTIIEYFVSRPWKNSIRISSDTLINLYSKRGLCNANLFKVILKNVFYSKNLELTITLKELYEYSKKELYIYSIQLEDFNLVELSYKTHPDLKVIDAITMSCAIPYVFEPVKYRNNHYIDGGLLCNYPINRAHNENKDEILGIQIIKTNINTIDNLNLFEFAYFLHCQLCKNQRENQEGDIKHQITIDCESMTVDDSFHVFFKKEIREKFILIGYEKATDFLKNIKSNN